MPKYTRATYDVPVHMLHFHDAYFTSLIRCDEAVPGDDIPVELPLGCYWPPMVKAVKGEKPGWELFVVARPVWRKVPAEV